MEEVMYHTKLKKGDVGRYVFLPGDPGRCEAIAAHFDDPVHVGMNREYNIYTNNSCRKRKLWNETRKGCP